MFHKKLSLAKANSSVSPGGEAVNAFWVLCMAEEYSKASLRIGFAD